MKSWKSLKACLITFVLLFSTPSFARQQDVCEAQSYFVMQITELRDMGWPKEFIISIIEYKDTPQGRKAQEEVPLIIDEVYQEKNIKKSPQELALSFYKKCLKLPKWPEKDIEV